MGRTSKHEGLEIKIFHEALKKSCRKTKKTREREREKEPNYLTSKQTKNK